MEFGDKVKQLLKARGLSQEELAGALGTNQQQVSRWASQNQPPTVRHLLPLARALGVTVDYLIDPAQEEVPRSELSEDERYLLRAIRAMKLDADEVIMRLELGARMLGSTPYGKFPERPVATITHGPARPEAQSGPKAGSRGRRKSS